MKKYYCETCERETTHYIKSNNSSFEIPSGWITMKIVNYNNDIEDNERKLIHSGNTEDHFCSKECMVNYFFYLKPTNYDNIINAIDDKYKNFIGNCKDEVSVDKKIGFREGLKWAAETLRDMSGVEK